MKMFKKLMAVALAGVMALVVLTGCASNVVNKKEIIAQLNDSMRGTVTYSEDKTDKADKVIALAKKAYDETAKDKQKDFDPNVALFGRNNTNVEPVKKELGVTNETKDQYIVRIAKINEYNSEYYKKHNTNMLMMDASYVPLNGSAYGNKATVSMNTVQFGDAQYLFMVIVRVA